MSFIASANITRCGASGTGGRHINHVLRSQTEDGARDGNAVKVITYDTAKKEWSLQTYAKTTDYASRQKLADNYDDHLKRLEIERRTRKSKKGYYYTDIVLNWKNEWDEVLAKNGKKITEKEKIDFLHITSVNFIKKQFPDVDINDIHTMVHNDESTFHTHTIIPDVCKTKRRIDISRSDFQIIHQYYGAAVTKAYPAIAKYQKENENQKRTFIPTKQFKMCLKLGMTHDDIYLLAEYENRKRQELKHFRLFWNYCAKERAKGASVSDIIYSYESDSAPRRDVDAETNSWTHERLVLKGQLDKQTKADFMKKLEGLDAAARKQEKKKRIIESFDPLPPTPQQQQTAAERVAEILKTTPGTGSGKGDNKAR